MRILIFLSLCFTLVACSSAQEKHEQALLHLKIGVSYFENANYPRALKELLVAEELDPKDPVIQNNLGLTYFMRQHYDLSEKHIKKAISYLPEYSDARNNLARVYIEEKKYAEAEKEIEIVLKDLTYTGFERAYVNQGLARFNQKKFETAKISFAKAIETQSDSCVAHSFYGRCFFELKDYNNAVDALDRAVGFCQNTLYDDPHYYSALAYYRLGNKEKSIARFEEIIRLYPSGQYRDKSKAMIEIIKKGGQ